jgi:hypothetical protein
VDAVGLVVSGEAGLGRVRFDDALAAAAPCFATAVLSPEALSSVTTSEESEVELGRVSSPRFVHAEKNKTTGTRTLKPMSTLVIEAT